MVAIVTRYHGPTNTKGTRYSASVQGYKVYVDIDHALDEEENHRQAAVKLCKKIGWDEDRFFGGSMASGDWAWVPVFTRDWEQRQLKKVEV